MATHINDLRGGQTATPPPVASTALTMKDINKLDRDRQAIAMMETFKAQYAVALPKHLTADRMVRLAMTAMRQNPALLMCEPASVFASVLVASQMGLEIGIDGQGFLVPYKGKCTFIPGWKGFVELVNRAGKAGVWTGAVFEGDKFEFALGDSPHVTHQPTGQVDETRANLRYVYAIGRVHDAKWPVIEVWPVAKVERHLKRFNKVGDKHYALKDDTNFIAYARKVALLQVLKYMPKSVELRAALAMDTGGSANIDMRDVINGEWTHVAADIGETPDGASLEDKTEAGDKTLGQAAETLAREEAETKPDTASPAVDAATTASPGTAAPAASPSETKPKRQRRTID
jgi:recombination protein RecT